MKFSIVIPVYNVEKYLDKCLNSIVEQTYKDFEVIVINDGSPDNSQDIIEDYVKRDSRFQVFQKENGGVSDARNYGVEYSRGDYLLFIDSDDYVEKDLLNELSKVLRKKRYDIVKFKMLLVKENGDFLEGKEETFESKELNLKEILEQPRSDLACSYCYNLEFWNNHSFRFTKGKVHEDFGLVPFILYQSTNRYYLDYYGYNYVQREGSIMHGSEKITRRVQDMLSHFDTLYELIQKGTSLNDEYKKEIISYIANGVIYNAKYLEDRELKDYIQQLYERDVFNLILDDTPKRKIKKKMLQVSPLIYTKTVLKRR